MTGLPSSKTSTSSTITFPSNRRSVISVVLVLVVLSMGGCAIFYGGPKEKTFPTTPDKTYKTSLQVMRKEFGIKQASRKKGRILTQWKVNPDQHNTKRTRMIVRVRKAGGGKKGSTVLVRSEQQSTDSWRQSFKHSEGEWESEGRNSEAEKAVMKLLRTRIMFEDKKRKAIKEAEEGEKLDERLREIEENESRKGR